jgi:hypothetical protein
MGGGREAEGEIEGRDRGESMERQGEKQGRDRGRDIVLHLFFAINDHRPVDFFAENEAH